MLNDILYTSLRLRKSDGLTNCRSVQIHQPEEEETMNSGSVMALGMMVGVMIAAWVLSRKSKGRDSEYDEMQLTIRAKGYQLGFYTALFLMVVLILLSEADLLAAVTPGFAAYLVLMISVTVFAAYCILHDAFLSVRGSAGSYLLIFGLIALLDGIITIRHLTEGGMLEAGKLGFSGGAPAAMCACFLILLITLILKTIRNRNGAEE